MDKDHWLGLLAIGMAITSIALIYLSASSVISRKAEEARYAQEHSAHPPAVKYFSSRTGVTPFHLVCSHGYIWSVDYEIWNAANVPDFTNKQELEAPTGKKR
jgi:hypothetical protein